MYTMRKTKESKKDKNSKQKRIIKEKQKEKQKQKQQISIVINSNNRNKKTSSAPKQQSQSQPQPQQSRISNNPPVVNVMGDSRPQVTASGNYSGLGQQNRIFAADSGLEQRLARLEKWENDSSSNPSPARSNAQILTPEIKKENEIIKAPDIYKREDYNYFSPTAQEEKEEFPNNNYNEDDEDEETVSIVTNETNTKVIADDEEFEIIPVKKKSVTTRLAEFFSPKPNELATVHPEHVPPLTAVALSQFDRNTQTQPEYLQKTWSQMKRPEKRQWALENASGYESAAINKMKVEDLNLIHAKVLSQRKA
jgi:hypothetical protein